MEKHTELEIEIIRPVRLWRIKRKFLNYLKNAFILNRFQLKKVEIGKENGRTI